MTSAKSIMNTQVITARPDMTCDEVQQLLMINRISGAPVVDREGSLVGVISVSDILASGLNMGGADSVEQALLDRMLAEEGFHLESITEGFVSDFMTRDVVRAFPETSVHRLAELMLHHRVHRVIIVEAHTNQVKGIVTSFDLLKVLKEMPSKSCGGHAHQSCKSRVSA
jgi:CBS domain-containing protein